MKNLTTKLTVASLTAASVVAAAPNTVVYAAENDENVEISNQSQAPSNLEEAKTQYDQAQAEEALDAKAENEDGETYFQAEAQESDAETGLTQAEDKVNSAKQEARDAFDQAKTDANTKVESAEKDQAEAEAEKSTAE